MRLRILIGKKSYVTHNFAASEYFQNDYVSDLEKSTNIIGVNKKKMLYANRVTGKIYTVGKFRQVRDTQRVLKAKMRAI